MTIKRLVWNTVLVTDKQTIKQTNRQMRAKNKNPCQKTGNNYNTNLVANLLKGHYIVTFEGTYMKVITKY